MVTEFPDHIPPFTWPYHLPVSEPYRVERSFNLLLPELDEAEEARMVRGDVVVLPNKRIEYAPIVGHSVKELGGCQPVPAEHQLRLSHALLLFCCEWCGHCTLQLKLNFYYYRTPVLYPFQTVSVICNFFCCGVVIFHNNLIPNREWW